MVKPLLITLIFTLLSVSACSETEKAEKTVMPKLSYEEAMTELYHEMVTDDMINFLSYESLKKFDINRSNEMVKIIA